MSNTIQIETIKLTGTKSGVISVANITDPYGSNTGEVTSIGVALDGDNVEWKVHIPKENIDQLIAALNKAK